MAHRPLLALASGLSAVLLMSIGTGLSVATTATVECGQLSAYTAPDPVAPTDGSLQLGLTPAWNVLATATISPAATTALPSGINSGPTCLALGFDGSGKVTSIDFAAEGTITGTVTYDSASAYYLFASRLLIPDSITSAYPALDGLFATSYQAGTTLAITFHVDTTTGGFTGFDGHAGFCGKATPVANGKAKVGKATLLAAILSAAAKAALAKDAGRSVCAQVHSIGTIDPSTGNITTTAAVVIKLDPAGPAITPPSTASLPSAEPSASSSSPFVAWLMLGAASAVALTMAIARRNRSTP